MKKILAVSALTLVFAAACTFGVLFAAQSAVANTGSGYSFAIDAAVLKKGSTGSEVKKVQQKLKNWGYYSGSVDGIYGSQTKKAVEYFQRKNGLSVDGIVGKQTFAALGINTGSSSSSSSSNGNYSNADMQLLARCIYAEARGESYGSGRGRRGHFKPREEPQIPQHHFGRYLPEGRVYRRFRRSDQPFARPDCDERGERRRERLGPFVRLSVLL